MMCLNDHVPNSFKQPNMREEYRVDTSCKTYQVIVQAVASLLTDGRQAVSLRHDVQQGNESLPL